MLSITDPIEISSVFVFLFQINSYNLNSGDLATAVRKAGLKFGAYHSWFEWFNPLYLRDKASKFKTRDFVNVLNII